VVTKLPLLNSYRKYFQQKNAVDITVIFMRNAARECDNLNVICDMPKFQKGQKTNCLEMTFTPNMVHGVKFYIII